MFISDWFKVVYQLWYFLYSLFIKLDSQGLPLTVMITVTSICGICSHNILKNTFNSGHFLLHILNTFTNYAYFRTFIILKLLEMMYEQEATSEGKIGKRTHMQFFCFRHFSFLGLQSGEWEKERMYEKRWYVIFSPSGALVFKVGLFNASAEGQKIAVALDPLCQLSAGQSSSQYSEEMAKHQCIQLRRPITHTPHTHSVNDWHSFSFKYNQKWGVTDTGFTCNALL